MQRQKYRYSVDQSGVDSGFSAGVEGHNPRQGKGRVGGGEG